MAACIGITPVIAMADRLHALGRPFAQVTFPEGLDVHETAAALGSITANPVTGGQIYMCGSGLFMDTAEGQALKSSPTSAIKPERFAANPALASAETAPLRVELARTGVTLDVGADGTILDVLDANGIDAACSCEQGVCGTCVTDVVEGTPDHRNSFLSVRQHASAKQMCLGVPRVQGKRITLDI